MKPHYFEALYLLLSTFFATHFLLNLNLIDSIASCTFVLCKVNYERYIYFNLPLIFITALTTTARATYYIRTRPVTPCEPWMRRVVLSTPLALRVHAADRAWQRGCLRSRQ